MSGRRGLLGQIARARADMLLRGHQRLKLELGAAVLDLPITVTSAMEGFAIRPA